MATTTRASRALLFMTRCRQLNSTSPDRLLLPITRASSSASQFSPSNFEKPYRPSSSPSSSLLSQSNYQTPTPEPESIWERPIQIRPPWAHHRARSVAIPKTRPPSRIANYFRRFFGRHPRSAAPLNPPPPFNAHNNPFRARKAWPPDFSKLPPKQQFHFEKTYRRRAKLKWAMPNWHRWTKLLQNTMLVSTLIYFVFILEPGHGMGTPFDGFRVWFFGKLRSMTGMSREGVEEARRLEEEAKQAGLERRTVWSWLNGGKA